MKIPKMKNVCSWKNTPLLGERKLEGWLGGFHFAFDLMAFCRDSFSFMVSGKF